MLLLHNLILLYQNIKLNSPQYFTTKIPNKQEFQKIAFNHSLVIDFQYFMNLYKKCNGKPYSFLAIDVIEQDKFTYSSLGKAWKKQTKAIEVQGEQQIKAIGKHEKLVVSNSLVKKWLWSLKRLQNTSLTKIIFW